VWDTYDIKEVFFFRPRKIMLKKMKLKQWKVTILAPGKGDQKRNPKATLHSEGQRGEVVKSGVSEKLKVAK